MELNLEQKLIKALLLSEDSHLLFQQSRGSSVFAEPGPLFAEQLRKIETQLRASLLDDIAPIASYTFGNVHLHNGGNQLSGAYADCASLQTRNAMLLSYDRGHPSAVMEDERVFLFYLNNPLVCSLLSMLLKQLLSMSML